MRRKFKGPYCIVEFINRHAVKLRNMNTGRCLPKAINIARLKRGRIRHEHNYWDPDEAEYDNDETNDADSDSSPSSEDNGSDSDSDDENNDSQTNTQLIPSQTQPVVHDRITTPTLTLQRREIIKHAPTIAFNTRAKSNANKAKSKIPVRNDDQDKINNTTVDKVIEDVANDRIAKTICTPKNAPKEARPSSVIRKSPRLALKQVPNRNQTSKADKTAKQDSKGNLATIWKI
jgi:hypothetical protein